MQRQKVPSAIFIGISFGAGLAQCFLQRHAPMVEHLVLSHCAPATRARRKMRRGAAIVKILELLPNRVFQMLISAVSRLRRRNYPPGSEWSDFARAYFCEITPQINKQVFLRFVHAGREMIQILTSESQAMDSWPGETLILSSADDHGSYTGLNELKRQYPRARTHVFEQGGHHTILLFPELYTAAIASFLQEVP